jgi:hypothetical protein
MTRSQKPVLLIGKYKIFSGATARTTKISKIATTIALRITFFRKGVKCSGRRNRDLSNRGSRQRSQPQISVTASRIGIFGILNGITSRADGKIKDMSKNSITRGQRLRSLCSIQ